MEILKKAGFARIVGIAALVCAYILTAVIFLRIGCAWGKNAERAEFARTAKTEMTTAKADNEYETTYRVAVRGGRLYMYELAGDTTTVIADCAISENVYPTDDIAELKRGIDFYDKSAAQSMFENFSS